MNVQDTQIIYQKFGEMADNMYIYFKCYTLQCYKLHRKQNVHLPFKCNLCAHIFCVLRVKHLHCDVVSKTNADERRLDESVGQG